MKNIFKLYVEMKGFWIYQAKLNFTRTEESYLYKLNLYKLSPTGGGVGWGGSGGGWGREHLYRRGGGWDKGLMPEKLGKGINI